MTFEEPDLTQEPRKVFVNFLIYNLRQIEWQIFFSYPREASRALRQLQGLIGSLSEEAQKSLSKEYEKLREWSRTGNCTLQDLADLYNVVCAYLHKTYLKEATFAKPRYPTKRLTMP